MLHAIVCCSPTSSTQQSRVHRAVTSHAQKHFIKLLLRGDDLPPAVARSGQGFTLSGTRLMLKTDMGETIDEAKGNAITNEAYNAMLPLGALNVAMLHHQYPFHW